MFFGNLRTRIFKIGWLGCGQCEKNQCKKTEHRDLVFKVFKVGLSPSKKIFVFASMIALQN